MSLAVTSARNVFDRRVTATIDDGSTVTSDGGAVRVQAIDNAALSTDVTMAADATGSSVAVSGGGMLAVNLVNGAVSATIDHSTIAAPTGDATGDVQVLAGDSSTVTARAETST